MTANTRKIYRPIPQKAEHIRPSRPRPVARVPEEAKVGPQVATLQGFGPMTRISTSFGEVPAQALRVRDMVRTRTGGFLRVEWIDRIVLGEGYLSYHPKAMPILIRANALGRDLPRADVTLAPNQPIEPGQIRLGSDIEVAKEALHRPNVARKVEAMFTYTVFHCGIPTSVCCEGLWVTVTP